MRAGAPLGRRPEDEPTPRLPYPLLLGGEDGAHDEAQSAGKESLILLDDERAAAQNIGQRVAQPYTTVGT